MSVYIKGMEMPIECSRNGCPLFSCIAAYETGMICTVLNEYVEPNKKNPRCPLIPVPDHGDLIDRNALLEHLGDTEYKGAVKRVLIQAPTIIPADKECGE